MSKYIEAYILHLNRDKFELHSEESAKQYSELVSRKKIAIDEDEFNSYMEICDRYRRLNNKLYDLYFN